MGFGGGGTFLRIAKYNETGKMERSLFDVKLELSLSSASHSVVSSMQEMCFKICPQIDIDAYHNTEIKPRKCENADREGAYNESHLYVLCMICHYLMLKRN